MRIYLLSSDLKHKRINCLVTWNLHWWKQITGSGCELQQFCSFQLECVSFNVNYPHEKTGFPMRGYGGLPFPISQIFQTSSNSLPHLRHPSSEIEVWLCHNHLRICQNDMPVILRQHKKPLSVILIFIGNRWKRLRGLGCAYHCLPCPFTQWKTMTYISSSSKKPFFLLGHL